MTAGATEGLTEYAEEPAQAIAKGLALAETPEEIFARMLKSLENLDVIPGSFILGAGGHAIHTRRESRAAQDFKDRQIDLHNDIEATNTKQLSPDHIRSLLEMAGVNTQVGLPAEDVLELRQGGLDLLTPLGLNEEEVARAAEAGQTIYIPLSRLHASLDQEQFQAAAEIMRQAPEAVNAAEAAKDSERVSERAKRLLELYQDRQAELDEMNLARIELREQAIAAINAVPNLKAQAEAAGGVENYVDNWLRVVSSFAGRMMASNQNPVGLFRRLALAELQNADTPNPLDLHQAAMYRSRSASLDEFINEALDSDPTSARPFRHLDNDFGDTVIELGAAQVVHIRRGHPDFDEWSRIPEIVEKGEQTSVGLNRVTGSESIAYILNEGDSSLVVVAAPNIGGTGRKNRVKRTIVLTAFRDKTSAVSHWLANNKAASSQSVEELQLNPPSARDGPLWPSKRQFKYIKTRARDQQP